MNKLLTIIAILLTLQSCRLDPYLTDGVEQKIDPTAQGIVKSGRALKTIVWYNQEIANSWWDDMDSVNTELVLFRQRQGDSLLAALKHIK